MDLWDALGLSPPQGLLAAGAGLFAAVVLAGRMLYRGSRAEPKDHLGLDDH